MKTLQLFALLLVMASCQEKKETTPDVPQQTPTREDVITSEAICFMKVQSRDSTLLNIVRSKDSVSGTFKWLPYEKDRKSMAFKGTIEGNTVTAIGNTMAEGMKYEEELIFTLADSTASVKFGEMTENDNGVWMYKNKNRTSEQILSKVDCN